MAKKRASKKFNWKPDNVRIDKTPNIPRNLRSIVANSPKSDTEIGGYLLNLLNKGIISSDEVNFLLRSRVFSR